MHARAVIGQAASQLRDVSLCRSRHILPCQVHKPLLAPEIPQSNSNDTLKSTLVEISLLVLRKTLRQSSVKMR